MRRRRLLETGIDEPAISDAADQGKQPQASIAPVLATDIATEGQ